MGQGSCGAPPDTWRSAPPCQGGAQPAGGCGGGGGQGRTGHRLNPHRPAAPQPGGAHAPAASHPGGATSRPTALQPGGAHAPAASHPGGAATRPTAPHPGGAAPQPGGAAQNLEAPHYNLLRHILEVHMRTSQWADGAVPSHEVRVTCMCTHLSQVFASWMITRMFSCEHACVACGYVYVRMPRRGCGLYTQVHVCMCPHKH